MVVLKRMTLLQESEIHPGGWKYNATLEAIEEEVVEVPRRASADD
jgi:hypothetical protein